ncbi:hypothetical protein DPMN_136731 [Dreissena polymorpha]|uniref:Uncharacterized protein n=1 Tax=Dreissena polymorpha TaxID=45954 RepID=A0A9D4G449_DREPO|nr:hypothetical protein DPMN_136731 [Dreissena polymorpha]
MLGPGVCPWAPSTAAALCLDPECAHWAPSTEAALCLEPECDPGLLQLRPHYDWTQSVPLGSFN